MIKLVETLNNLPTCLVARHQNIKFHYIFALNRYPHSCCCIWIYPTSLNNRNLLFLFLCHSHPVAFYQLCTVCKQNRKRALHHRGYHYVFPLQEESTWRSQKSFGRNSANRRVWGHSGVRCLLPVWTYLQRHVHKLRVH